MLQPGDLCLTMGAGDLTTLPGELLAGADNGGAAARERHDLPPQTNLTARRSTPGSGAGGPRLAGPRADAACSILLSVLAVGGSARAVVSGSLHSPVVRVRNVIVIGNTHTPRARCWPPPAWPRGTGPS